LTRIVVTLDGGFMIRTILIEDEKQQREYIAALLHDHFPLVDLVGEADGVHSGLCMLRDISPDLVLLDVRLKDGTSFDILRSLKNITFRTIFITAYEEYALQAIKFKPSGFLLKPVSLEDLREAISQASSQIIKDLNQQIVELHANLMAVKKKRIILRTSEKLHLVPVHTIMRCEANRNYSSFYLRNGKKITVCAPMKDYESLLVEQGFFRIHKSHIVNLSFIDTYVRSDGGHVLLSEGTRLPVADRKKAMLLDKFKNI